MQEMVGTARRMGNHAIATRHMTYLLEVMFDHCSDTEKTDFSSQLSVLTSRHPGKFDHCSDLEKTNARTSEEMDGTLPRIASFENT